jgi:uncharacterized protein (TIGR03000 family)
MKKFVCLAAFGVVALLAVSPAPASAGWYGWGPRVSVGWGRYGWYDGYRYPRYVYRPWVTGYYYPDTPPAQYTYGAYSAQDQAEDANAATIRMQVPSNASVSIEGQATSQRGMDRTFISPTLAPGREYVYHVRVQWEENGKAVERNRDITVHAGDRISLTIDK